MDEIRLSTRVTILDYKSEFQATGVIASLSMIFFNLDAAQHGLWPGFLFEDSRVYRICMASVKKNPAQCKLYLKCPVECNLSNHAHVNSDGRVLVEISETSTILKVF